MEAFITQACRLGRSERGFIADHLTNQGSDFQKALAGGDLPGAICLCMDKGEIVGWARIEPWFDGEEHRVAITAFTGTSYRRRGIASFCVMGLVASGVFADVANAPAIFSRAMLSVTQRAGLSPVLYIKEGDLWAKTTI